MRLTQLALVIGAFCTTQLVGCGGGGSGSGDATYEVTAIDGYLQNATVWLDLNGNYQQDDGEPSATSGAGGKATLDVSDVSNPEQYSVVVQAIAGTTIDEDEPDTTISTSYVMSAPAGENAVTPLSTLVQLYIEQGYSEEDAKTEVADQLGISSDDVLGDFIENASDSATYAAQNIVASNILPESSDDMAEEVSTLLDGSSNGAMVVTVIEAVTALIKTNIESGDSTSIIEENPTLTSDSDGDGYADFYDAFPDDSTEWIDTDGDGTGNNSDTDDDDDDVADVDDAFPLDATESVDTDGDGIGNEADTDDDNDEVADVDDDFPLDANESVDTDGDGIGNNADTDDDGDDVADVDDAFPLDANESVDTDGDGIGNEADTDDDNDGTADVDDDYPLDADKTTDTESSVAVWDESNWDEATWQ